MFLEKLAELGLRCCMLQIVATDVASLAEGKLLPQATTTLKAIF